MTALNQAWAQINALGGAKDQNNSYDQGIVDTAAKALDIIERLGGVDPLTVSGVHSQHGEAVAFMVERERDPTFPRFYTSRASADKMAEFVTVSPAVTIVPLYRAVSGAVREAASADITHQDIEYARDLLDDLEDPDRDESKETIVKEWLRKHRHESVAAALASRPREVVETGPVTEKEYEVIDKWRSGYGVLRPVADEGKPRDGWRDISTAPRNEYVLVFCPEAEEATQIMVCGFLEFENDPDPPAWYELNCDVRPNSLDVEPTHWQPLPSPPVPVGGLDTGRDVQEDATQKAEIATNADGDVTKSAGGAA